MNNIYYTDDSATRNLFEAASSSNSETSEECPINTSDFWSGLNELWNSVDSVMIY